MQVLYFHGLNSGPQSPKFLAIQKQWPQAKCFYWTPTEKQLSQRIKTLAVEMSTSTKDVLIIGDSAGSNLALQFRTEITKANSWCKLIIIAPIFNTKQLIDSSILPKNIIDQIVTVATLNDAMLLLPREDEILDYSEIPGQVLRSTEVKRIPGGHAVLGFSRYIKDMVLFSNTIAV